MSGGLGGAALDWAGLDVCEFGAWVAGVAACAAADIAIAKRTINQLTRNIIGAIPPSVRIVSANPDCVNW
jgi:hypothetical protein